MSRLAAAALVALTACRGREAAPAGEPPPRDAAIDASAPAREPWRCAVPDEPAAPAETFTVGGRSWRLAGGVLSAAGAAADPAAATGAGAAAGPAAATAAGAGAGPAAATAAGAGAGPAAATGAGAAAGPAAATGAGAPANSAAATAAGAAANSAAATGAGAAAGPAAATGAGAAANSAAATGAGAAAGPAAATGAGSAANAAGASGAGDVTIAVVADATGSAPATLAALRRLRAQFGTPDLVVSLGGMGSTAAELRAVFAALAGGATWPVVAMPGDLEAVPAQAEAIAAARSRGAVVLDGRRVLWIELPGVTIGLVPGAGAAERLVAGAAGCRYERAGVAAVLAALAARPGLRVLATAEPPRSEGDPPTGERAITASADVIDLALHGGSDGPTPPRSGRRDGSATALTPGSADALPRLTARHRRATAGLLRVHGTMWSWQPLSDAR